MRKYRHFSLSGLSLSIGLSLASLSGAGVAADAAVSPEQWLLEQIRVGEASHRDDLVTQSLYRLELMDPNNPDVMAARMRLALRQGDQQLAQQQLDKLKAQAPNSEVYKQAKLNMALTTPEGRQQLQQARLLATAGHVPEAVQAYDKLFEGTPPTVDLAVEYLRVVARQPGQENNVIAKLEALRQTNPGNGELRRALAGMLLDTNQTQKAYAVLEKMAADSNTRGDAADLWMAEINRTPVGEQSVASLQRYLVIFAQDPSTVEARKKLADQQKLLSDPAFIARSRGLAMVDSGKGAVAIPELQKALASSPNDSDVLGALGQAYARQDNRAKALEYFQRALKADPTGYDRDKWISLIKSNQYWLAIQSGDKALKANQLDVAQQKYQQARGIDNTDSYAVLGLGDVAVARKDDAGAERLYQQALRLDSTNSSAVRGLVNIYQRQSPEKAMAYLDQLPRSQRKAMQSAINGIQSDVLQQQAQALEQQQQWAGAADKLQQALKLSPNDVWLTYRLAKDLHAAGRTDEADRAFNTLAQQLPGDPQQVYAHALYLSGTDRDRAALAQVDGLPQAKWDANIRELSDRLHFSETLKKAQDLRDAGHEDEAIAYLRQQPANTRIDLTLADWALEREDYDAALVGYRDVLKREPDNDSAHLGEIEAFVAQGELEQARTQLQALQQVKPAEAPSMNTERRVAGAWASVGDMAKAQAIFDRITPQAAKEPGQDGALVMRDAARFEQKQGNPDKALDYYRDAMVSSGIAPTKPQDNDTFTRLTRNDEKDDWLKRGVRSDAADLYRQQDVNVTLDHDYARSSGTGGYSDLTANTTMLQMDAPLNDGRMFLRTDVVNMQAGSFKGGPYKEKFGTCYVNGCQSGNSQNSTGASLSAGWKNEHWEGDFGTTPMGFDVVDWVGGLSYSNDWNHIGWTVNAHRRPISSSLLAFGGQKDDQTGITWGGVRRTGLGISGSYDRGEAHGVWADLSADQLTGKNVADNSRIRWMAGYYYKLINENNRRVTVGLSNMIWHYDKDLSGYTLGQGGYYSPQEYVSFGVPVNYRQRTENWSWELGGSVSWSHSKTDTVDRYPIKGLIPAPDKANNKYTDKYDTDSGSSSSGVGYTLRAIVERRVTSNWFIGAGVDIQEAKDYTPSHGLIYVRYSAAGWQGDMDLPPQPLTPYADFK
ncbi:cellulose synthase complex outer membrane protein BcsC [Hafnia alvei]|uniref:cellulose synthase complex outer membrane protein BcsC n=1 Tax=Hafnia alvei TaxID=569 RepID=UPI00345CAF7D